MCWCVRVYRNGESHAYHHVSEMYLTMRIRVARCSVSHCIMTYQLLRIRAVIRCVSNVSERISKSVSEARIKSDTGRPRDTAGPVIREGGGTAADTGAETRITYQSVSEHIKSTVSQAPYHCISHCITSYQRAN